MGCGNLDDRWSSFGWHVLHAVGNDVDALDAAFDAAKRVKGRPTVIVADTVKGFGVPFMENAEGWHHKVPDAAQYAAACDELARRGEAAR
jgi:transketolase